MFTMLKAIFNELVSINASLSVLMNLMEKQDDGVAMAVNNAISNEDRAVKLYEKAVKEHGRD